MGGSWSKFYLMLGSVEKDYLLVIYILAISTLLNVYYLLEIPAKAFFQPKRTNIQVTKHPLTVYPTFFAAKRSFSCAATSATSELLRSKYSHAFL